MREAAISSRGEETRRLVRSVTQLPSMALEYTESAVEWHCFLSENDLAALSNVSKHVSQMALDLYLINFHKVAAAKGSEGSYSESVCSDSSMDF